MKNTNITQELASSITKAASRQTYYTIRYLVDHDLIADAYRAYGYFRWMDDVLDAESGSRAERSVFVRRQESLLEACYRGEIPLGINAHEEMLVELVRKDVERAVTQSTQNSGLQYYLSHMMAVMSFDVERRGRLISQAELNEYTHHLAGAVTEAMHYFVGHCCYSPHDETRYLAVTAAHITHMLRDTFDDVRAGYFNIPREVLDVNHITPEDVSHEAYRTWVQSRVDLARMYFHAGRGYLSRVANPRCRVAGLAYTARFEWLLDTIEREGYLLRPQYDERKSFKTGLSMGLDMISSLINLYGQGLLASVFDHKRPLRES